MDDNYDGPGKEASDAVEKILAKSQKLLLEAIVCILLTHQEKQKTPQIPGIVPLLELHRASTLFLIQDAGLFRSCNVELRKPDGERAEHVPPDHSSVPDHTKNFFETLSSMWVDASPFAVSAYCIWRINWIHPFKNGNGRSARAFAYLCLCLKIGYWLPGDPTIIDQITRDKPEYEARLRDLDASYAAGALDLTPMEIYLEKLFEIQLRHLA